MNGAQGFLLDTSVVLHATRQRSPVSIAIDAQFKLSESRFRPAICEVSVGELLAFSKEWGEKRRALLKVKDLGPQVDSLPRTGTATEQGSSLFLGLRVILSGVIIESRHINELFAA